MARLLLFAALIAFVLAQRVVHSIQTARSLGWFGTNGGDVCDAERSDCNQLVLLAHVGTVLPIVAAILLLVSSVFGQEESRSIPWFRTYATALFGFATLAAISLQLAPRIQWVHPQYCSLLFLCVLVTASLRALEVSDHHRQKTQTVERAGIERQTTAHPALGEMWAELLNHRISFVIVVAYAALIILVPQSSGQVLDGLRAWHFHPLDNSTSQMTLGIVTTCLLGLALRESAGALARHEGEGPAPFSAILTVAIGVTVMLIGAIVALASPLDSAFALLGVLILALGLMGLRRGRLRRVARLRLLRAQVRALWPLAARALRSMEWSRNGLGKELLQPAGPRTKRLSAVAEWIVAVPFLVLGAALAALGLDQYLTEGRAESSVPYASIALILLVLGAFISVDSDGMPSKPQVAPMAWTLLWLAPPLTILIPLITLHVAEPKVTLLCVVVLILAPSFAYLIAVVHGLHAAGLGMSCRLAVFAAVSAAVAIHASTQKTSEVLGTITFVNIAVAVFVWLGYLVTRGSKAVEAPALLKWLNAKRLPIAATLVVWWVLAGIVAPKTLHDVPLESRGVKTEPPTLKIAFKEWTAAQPELRPGYAGSVTTVPMMLVASHGGGIRAAYWTAIALDCLTARPSTPAPTPVCNKPQVRQPKKIQAAARRIFLASGVSGGSVGIAAYAQNLMVGNLRNRSWMDTALGADFASPTIGWGLFHDLPNHVLGVEPTRSCSQAVNPGCTRHDRAETLSSTLDHEHPTNPVGMRQVWDERLSSNPDVSSRAQTVPAIIFNSVLAGGHFPVITSALKLGQQNLKLGRPGGSPTASRNVRPDTASDPLPLGGDQESIDLLCRGDDMRLSTAAMLSARFPVVSPSGRLSLAHRCKQPPEARFRYRSCAKSNCTLRMVDGGYLDNSGMLTISGLWPELRRLVANHNRTSHVQIAPVMLDIDSAYQSRGPELVDSSTLGESMVPLATFGVRSAVEAYARGRMYRSFPPGCIATIAPAIHPGLLAPLGWTLSQSSMDELRSAIDDRHHPGKGKGLGRIKNMRRMQGWLGGETLPKAQQDKLFSCIPR